MRSVGDECSPRVMQSSAAAVEMRRNPEGIIAPLSPIWMPLGKNGLAATTSDKESKHRKGGVNQRLRGIVFRIIASEISIH